VFSVAVAIVEFGNAAGLGGGFDVEQTTEYGQLGLTQAITEQPVVADAL
jgi:hypothetical protein